MWCSLIEMKYPYSSRIYILTTGCLESGVESGADSDAKDYKIAASNTKGYRISGTVIRAIAAPCRACRGLFHTAS
jgi:hypothetical protein